MTIYTSTTEFIHNYCRCLTLRLSTINKVIESGSLTSTKKATNDDNVHLCYTSFASLSLKLILPVVVYTEYGLNSVIFTQDISRALTFAKKIQAGNVRVNTGAGMDPNMPFGGFKQSGWGAENGREGIEAYTSLKSVTVKLD